jgi:hypothetical protein
MVLAVRPIAAWVLAIVGCGVGVGAGGELAPLLRLFELVQAVFDLLQAFFGALVFVHGVGVGG